MSSFTTRRRCGARPSRRRASVRHADDRGAGGRAAARVASVERAATWSDAVGAPASRSSIGDLRVVAPRRTRRRRPGASPVAPRSPISRSRRRGPGQRHVSPDHTGTHRTRTAASYARAVDIARHLDARARARRRADAITMARFRAHDLEVTTKPDLTPVSEADQAVERAIRDTPRGRDRITRCSARSSDDRRRRRRRVPLDHRPDRRHEELRARRADLGDAHRARARGRAGRRRRVGARAAACAGGPAAGIGAFRERRARSTCRRSRRSTTRSSRSRGTRAERFERRRHRRRSCSRSRTGAGARAASATSGSTCSSPRARSTSRSTRSSSLWDIAALVPIVEEAGGRWSTVDGRADVDGGSFVCTNGRAARRRARGARRSSVRAHVGGHRRDRHRHVVGQGGRGRRRRQRRRPRRVSRTSSTCRARCGSSTTPRAAWHDGPRRALDALGDIDAARRVGRGDGAVADRGRRRRRPVHARPALRRRARPQRRTRRASPSAASSRSSCAGRSSERPDARGYWMAQAVANHALTGEPVISTTVAATACPLVRLDSGWDRPSSPRRRRTARADAGDRRCRASRSPRCAARPGACSKAARSTRWPSRSSPAPTRSATCS